MQKRNRWASENKDEIAKPSSALRGHLKGAVKADGGHTEWKSEWNVPRTWALNLEVLISACYKNCGDFLIRDLSETRYTNYYWFCCRYGMKFCENHFVLTFSLWRDEDGEEQYKECRHSGHAGSGRGQHSHITPRRVFKKKWRWDLLGMTRREGHEVRPKDEMYIMCFLCSKESGSWRWTLRFIVVGLFLGLWPWLTFYGPHSDRNLNLERNGVLQWRSHCHSQSSRGGNWGGGWICTLKGGGRGKAQSFMEKYPK